MKVSETSLPGVLVIEPEVFSDPRGFFFELWNQRHYAESGLDFRFVQDNLSFSKKGILRGLHFQSPQPQGKLVQVLQGEAYDVAVDIRLGSPHFGKWVGVTLSFENHAQLYIPEGFAHGFCVLSESALFSYKCTDFYNSKTEISLRWDDPDIGIDWPIDNPTLSKKDKNSQNLKDLPTRLLPIFT